MKTVETSVVMKGNVFLYSILVDNAVVSESSESN